MQVSSFIAAWLDAKLPGWQEHVLQTLGDQKRAYLHDGKDSPFERMGWSGFTLTHQDGYVDFQFCHDDISYNTDTATGRLILIPRSNFPEIFQPSLEQVNEMGIFDGASFAVPPMKATDFTNSKGIAMIIFDHPTVTIH